MPALASPNTAVSDETLGEFSSEWIHSAVTCDEWEPRKDSEPAIVPSVLFDEETVRAINWKAVFGF
jgi:hypothetical protein